MSKLFAIIYSRVDGAHMFTSGDSMLTGLCVGSNNALAAYHDVALQIENLLLFNHGITESYGPCASLESILARYKGRPQTEFWKRISKTLIRRDDPLTSEPEATK